MGALPMIRVLINSSWSDGSKPLPWPILISHKWGSVTFISSKKNFTANAQATALCDELENKLHLRIIAISSMGQWVISWIIVYPRCYADYLSGHVICRNNMYMMTSWNGNIFCVTGHLCGEFTDPRWIPLTKASDAELWCFLWSAPEWTAE